MASRSASHHLASTKSGSLSSANTGAFDERAGTATWWLRCSQLVLFKPILISSRAAVGALAATVKAGSGTPLFGAT